MTRFARLVPSNQIEGRAYQKREAPRKEEVEGGSGEFGGLTTTGSGGGAILTVEPLGPGRVLQNHRSNGHGTGMGEGQVDPANTGALGRPGGASMQADCGAAALVADYFHIDPAAGAAYAGAECLEDRFLRGKSGGQRGGDIPQAETIGELARREDPAQASFAPPLAERVDARNQDDIDAGPEYHGRNVGEAGACRKPPNRNPQPQETVNSTTGSRG